MSVAKPKTNTSQASTVNTTNLNVQDTEGVTLAGSDSNTINITDGGAFDFARSVGLDLGDSLRDLGRGAFDASSDNLNRGLDFAGSTFKGATDTIGDALNTVAGVSSDSLDRLSQSHESSLSTLGDLVSQVFGFAGDAIEGVTDNAQRLAGQSIAGNQSLAKTTSESGDDRVTRVAMYAFLAVGAIFVVQAFRK